MARIFAAPTTRVTKQQRKDEENVWALDLQTVINKAQPGDVIDLLPGEYVAPVVIAVSGTKDKPITIRGPKDGIARMEGGRTREQGRAGGMKPTDGDFAFIKIFHAEHIRIERLNFENCWPCSIFVRSAQNIDIRNCRGRGSRYFVYARQTNNRDTNGITLDGVNWMQDPYFEMWDGKVTWKDVKAKPDHIDNSFFNGAMFGSFDIRGDVTIRNCEVSHAFNAIRMDIRRKRIKGTKSNPRISRNRHVRIYNNKFSFIRDNAVEPEKGAEDWAVYNNRFFNCHAALSLDGVAIRDYLIIGNWFLNTERPGGRPKQKNTGGKIFKFLAPPHLTDDMEPAPRKGLWSVFNSVQARTNYAVEGRSAQWTDRYTLMGLYPKEHPIEPAPLQQVFEFMTWTAGMEVTDMVTNEPCFPRKYTAEGGRVSGHSVSEPVFDVTPFQPNLSAPLGGWNGELNRTDAVKGFTSTAFKIKRRTGKSLTFRTGLPHGASPVAELGLKDI
ncbi:right-handed parallel beta-helix repeat-containing protein [Tropicibacter sp. Alg240-R139]|uniref:right-handed parallel beta-helix repeat-containing protein n=1 Tax=Tropicibacter sp. Alg240-R139 TaxID=2305991 RepID=UPI0013E05283|nr:right-handed parallel beta-helix repeat-containing protein [Tropicibacter sp. Alg240-R139]